MASGVIRRTSVIVAAFVMLILTSVALTASAGAAQTPTERTESEKPVPCDVAMVVGCVASVDGPDGPISTTLEVADPSTEPTGETGGDETGGDNTDRPVATASTDGVVNGAAAGTEGTVAGTEGTNGTVDAATALLTPPETSDRPLTDIDPWEGGGLKSNFGTRSIPISHYQIGADVDGWLGVPDPLDSFVASQTNWAFTTATFLVILASNSLDWAFEFPLAEDLIGDAGVLAQSFSINFFGFGLSTSVYGLALSVTMLVAGFKAVTKGMIAAGSEVALAFVAYVVLMVLTLTSGFGNAGLTVARISSDLSSEIASFAAGQDRQAECATKLLGSDASAGNVPVAGAEANTSAIPAATSSACSFGFAIQRSLVELPYQNLQWGQVLDGVPGKERCAALNLDLLAEGPWGNDDEPRDRMRSASECEENANFNHQATYIRLGIASANTISAAVVTLLLLIVAAMLLWQQVKLLFLTVLMPHALVMAILPGQSRKLAWQWVEHLVGVVIRTIILALGLVIWLSLFSLIVYEQLTLRGIFLSLFASMAMAVSGFYGLYRLSKLTSRMNPIARGRSTEGADAEPVPATRGAGTGLTRTVTGARSTLRSVRGISLPGRSGPSRSEPPVSTPSRSIPTPVASTPSGTPTPRTAPSLTGAGSTRAGSTVINRPTIGGGPGDLPGGGAAATRSSTGPQTNRQSAQKTPRPRSAADANRPVERTAAAPGRVRHPQTKARTGNRPGAPRVGNNRR